MRTQQISPTTIGPLIISVTLIGGHSAFGAQARKAPARSQKIPVVLEVIEKDARPAASGDEFLYFRFYQDGTAEFEMKPVDRSLELKFHKTRLTNEDLDDLWSLAESWLDAPADFDPMQRLEEKVSISRISIRDKDGDYQQRVIHHYRPENEKTRWYFPKQFRTYCGK